MSADDRKRWPHGQEDELSLLSDGSLIVWRKGQNIRPDIHHTEVKKDLHISTELCPQCCQFCHSTFIFGPFWFLAILGPFPSLWKSPKEHWFWVIWGARLSDNKASHLLSITWMTLWPGPAVRPKNCEFQETEMVSTLLDTYSSFKKSTHTTKKVETHAKD